MLDTQVSDGYNSVDRVLRVTSGLSCFISAIFLFVLFGAAVWGIWVLSDTLSLIFAIVLFIVSGYFVLVAARAYPPGRVRPMYLHPTTFGDVMTALAIAAVTLAGGLFLLVW